MWRGLVIAALLWLKVSVCAIKSISSEVWLFQTSEGRLDNVYIYIPS